MERKYIGIDLHKASFHACALTEDGTRLWEAKFPRTVDGIAALAARGIIGAQLAVEATGPTWAFVDAVTALGVHACVVDPRKTKLKAGFAAKTDRLDARRLADALRRQSVVSIYMPPPAIRELRELCRGRQQLVRARTRVIQAIRALLLRQDAPEPPVTSLIGRRGLQWLATVRVGGQRAGLTSARARAARRTCGGAGRGCCGQSRSGAGPDRDRAAAVARGRPGLELGAAGGDRHDRSVCARPVARLLRRDCVASRLERRTAALRTHHATRLALAAVGAGGSGDAGDETAGCLGRWARRLAIHKGIKKARVALARRLCDEIVQTWQNAG